MAVLDIYYADIMEWKEDRLYLEGFSLLQKERQEKVASCHFFEDKRRSLAAGLLIRHACLQRGLDYDAMHFYSPASGKPWTDGLQYNVSHSGNCAIVIAGDASAGIDVERLDERFAGEKGAVRFSHIVQKTFDEKEKAMFAELNSGGCLSREAFAFAAEVWTRKESFAKECGAGLGMDFSQIHTQDTAGFYTFELPGQYTVSIFLKEPAKIQFPVCVHAPEMLR